MSTATAHLLQEFENLPPEDQREFSSIVLKKTARFDYEAPQDEEMISAASIMATFLDEEEDAAER